MKNRERWRSENRSIERERERERERVAKQMEEEYLRFLDILGAIWNFFFFLGIWMIMVFYFL